MGDAVPIEADTSGRSEEIASVVRGGDVRRPPETWEGIPVVSPDQQSTPSALLPLTAFRWFIEYGARYGSGRSNRVVLTTADGLPAFDPFACAHKVGVPSSS